MISVFLDLSQTCSFFSQVSQSTWNQPRLAGWLAIDLCLVCLLILYFSTLFLFNETEMQRIFFSKFPLSQRVGMCLLPFFSEVQAPSFSCGNFTSADTQYMGHFLNPLSPTISEPIDRATAIHLSSALATFQGLLALLVLRPQNMGSLCNSQPSQPVCSFMKQKHKHV